MFSLSKDCMVRHAPSFQRKLPSPMLLDGCVGGLVGVVGVALFFIGRGHILCRLAGATVTMAGALNLATGLIHGVISHRLSNSKKAQSSTEQESTQSPEEEFAEIKKKLELHVGLWEKGNNWVKIAQTNQRVLVSFICMQELEKLSKLQQKVRQAGNQNALQQEIERAIQGFQARTQACAGT